MNKRLKSPLSLFIQVLFFLWTCACQERESSMLARFASPVHLAVSNPGDGNFPLLWVSSHELDALRVVKTGAFLPDFQLWPAPNGYFPLSVPTAGWSQGLFPLQNTNFLLVSSAVDHSLELVDTQALRRVQNTAGQPLKYRHSEPFVAENMAIAFSEHNCQAPGCLARVYLANPNARRIDVVELDATNSSGDWRVVGAYPVPGVPHAVVAHPKSPVIFVTEADGSTLWRLTLTSPAPESVQLDRFDMGGVVGSIHIEPNGNILAVSRPILRDIVFYQDILASNLLPLTPKHDIVPPPQCIPLCGQPASCPSTTHPADLAICTTEDGQLQASEASYRGLYVAEPLQHGLFVPPEPYPVLRDASCPSAPNPRALLTLATLSGRVGAAWLSGETTLSPALWLNNACRPPIIKKNKQTPSFVDWLRPCSTSEASIDYLRCVSDNPNADVGQIWVARRPEAFPVHVRAQWEGVLPEMSTQQAQLLPNGALWDASLPWDRARHMLQVGDIVAFDAGMQIPIPQNCPGLGSCMEVRIAAISAAPDGGTWITPTVPLAPECFLRPNALAYHIRVGEQFLITSETAKNQRYLLRAPLDKVVGMSRETPAVPFRFAIKGDFIRAQGENGCLLYHESGALHPRAYAIQDTFLNRQSIYGFKIDDVLRMQSLTNVVRERQGSERVRPVLPGSMAWLPSSGRAGPWLGVSFTGSNSIWLADFNSTFEQLDFRVLR